MFFKNAGEKYTEKTNHTTHEKIAVAKANQTKSRVKIVIVGAIFLIFFGVTVAYLIPHINPSNTTPPPTENIQSTQPDTEDSIGADADAGVFREQFMVELAQYESEIEPGIAEIQLRNWDEQKYTELERLKARAIENFSGGEYLPAREDLQQARAMAEEASAEYVSRLTESKREANEAFANDRAPEAEKAVQQALRLNPADAEMLALQKRVEVMPQVLDLLRQVGVARNENRPEKEIAVLQKVLSVDPSRGGVQTRLQALQTQLKQQRFSGAVSKAHGALDSGDLDGAAKQVALAKSISPADTELGALQNRLQQALVEREFENQSALGEQAGQQDDWQAAATHFELARRLKPSDKTTVENHDSAQQVVNVAQQIDLMLASEHRLGDKDVLDSVSAYLREVESVVGLSPGLQKAHRELARKVDLYQTEVDVIVVSDNSTYIIVRGHGQVGKTSRRTIRLRPGKRVFEGTRAGYKSKLVTVDIKPEAPPVEVTVICDEKI